MPLTGLRAGRYVESLLRPDRAARRVVAAVLDQLRAEAELVTASGSTDLPTPDRPLRTLAGAVPTADRSERPKTPFASLGLSPDELDDPAALQSAIEAFNAGW